MGSMREELVRMPLSSMGLVSHWPDSWQMGPMAAMMASGVREPTWTVSLETVGMGLV